jgi:hypothetical protein
MATLTVLNSDLSNNNRVLNNRYSGNTSTTVVFPEDSTCTIIGDNAFLQMYNLTSLTLPPGLSIIGNSAFKQCMALPEVILPESTTIIGNNAFSDCRGFTGIRIPPNVISIGSKAFHGISALRYINLNDATSLTTISGEAFNGCGTGLAGMVIPATVTRIGFRAFFANGLRSVFFKGTNLLEIGQEAFFQNPSLNNITLPTSLTTIRSLAFGDCHMLPRVYIPASVTTIDNNAFLNCAINTAPDNAGIMNIHFQGAPPGGTGDIMSPSNNGIGYITQELANGSWASIVAAGGLWRGLDIQVYQSNPTPIWQNAVLNVILPINWATWVYFNEYNGAIDYTVVDEFGVAYPSQDPYVPVQLNESQPGMNFKIRVYDLSAGYNIFSVMATLPAAPVMLFGARIMHANNPGETVQGNGDIFNMPSNGGGDGNPVVCFLENAPVLTPNGYTKIANLAVGDKVMTGDGRSVAIQRIHKQRVAASSSVNPYVIPKGLYGATTRLLISPEHRVATEAGMIEAKNLGLKQEKMTGSFDYYNLELPSWSQDNMVVAGVVVESLAPVRRITMTLGEFKKALIAKYGELTPAIEAKIQKTCRLLANGRVECPVLSK